MQLSFIALSVIPQLRITDGGTLESTASATCRFPEGRRVCPPFGHLHIRTRFASGHTARWHSCTFVEEAVR